MSLWDWNNLIWSYQKTPLLLFFLYGRLHQTSGKTHSSTLEKKLLADKTETKWIFCTVSIIHVYLCSSLVKQNYIYHILFIYVYILVDKQGMLTNLSLISNLHCGEQVSSWIMSGRPVLTLYMSGVWNQSSWELTSAPDSINILAHSPRPFSQLKCSTLLPSCNTTRLALCRFYYRISCALNWKKKLIKEFYY
jgi:hypothetical protein